MSDTGTQTPEQSGTTPAPINSSQFERLKGQVQTDVRGLQILLFVGFFIVIVSIAFGGAHVENRIDDLQRQLDEASLSYEPLIQLLADGTHCYDSGAAASAAQLRIFTAADNADLEYRIDDTIAGLDKPYSMIPSMPSVAAHPTVSKTGRNFEGKLCFDVKWPNDKKPRWAGGY